MVAAATVKGIVQLSEDSFQNCNSASVDDNNNNNDEDDYDNDDNDDIEDNFDAVYDNTGVSKSYKKGHLRNQIFWIDYFYKVGQ